MNQWPLLLGIKKNLKQCQQFQLLMNSSWLQWISITISHTRAHTHTLFNYHLIGLLLSQEGRTLQHIDRYGFPPFGKTQQWNWINVEEHNSWADRLSIYKGSFPHTLSMDRPMVLLGATSNVTLLRTLLPGLAQLGTRSCSWTPTWSLDWPPAGPNLQSWAHKKCSGQLTRVHPDFIPLGGSLWVLLPVSN